MTARTILIAGAGLGGLTAAACLLRMGHDVHVFEQAPQLGEVGAGIQISANAGRVFDFLGIEDKVAEAGALPDEYRFRTFDTGEVLQTIRFGERYLGTYGVPYVVIHRADLHTILVDAVKALRPDAIRTGNRVMGFDETDDGVTLHIDGKPSVKGDLVIGADGIRSAVRSKILGPSEADFTGDSVWRVLVKSEDLPPEYRTNCVEIFVGPGRHAVIYPLRRGELINLVGCVEQASWDEESWTAKRPWTEMRADFQGWNAQVSTIIDKAPRDECYRWVLKNRRPVTNWSSSHATLLGDAAHPTLPYMAQGAAMSIEDGAVLARALDQEADIPAALQLYQRNRIGRTTKVVEESTMNRALFHMPNMEELRGLLRQARTSMQSANAWLFSYDALQGRAGLRSAPRQLHQNAVSAVLVHPLPPGLDGVAGLGRPQCLGELLNKGSSLDRGVAVARGGRNREPLQGFRVAFLQPRAFDVEESEFKLRRCVPALRRDFVQAGSLGRDWPPYRYRSDTSRRDCAPPPRSPGLRPPDRA